jgi:acetylornithine deacetylase/succinyl-diaminopimelate desuccinylase-like protein
LWNGFMPTGRAPELGSIFMSTPSNVVELLQELVRIPSVNPAGDPGTDGVGEARIAGYLAQLLRSWGAVVELREVEPGRPNVVARFLSDRPGKPKVLFAPHTDTVSVSGMTIDPFGGEVRDGRIWGRGASDTKGPMAAMLWALYEERDRLAGLSHEIWFAGLAGEEAGQPGAKALAAEEHFDFVLAGEPTGLDVVHTHKGALWLTLTTRGVAVHAASPQLGSNAIYKMADVIRCIRDEVAPALAQITDPVLGSVTISPGVIQGGSKTNIVPDFCRVEVDVRTVPGSGDLAGRITELLRKVCPDLEVGQNASLPMATDPMHPLVQALIGVGARAVGAPWFCDAAIFAAKGVPAVAIGPGSIAQAHTKDEWILQSDLEGGVAFFRRFLAGL